MNKVLEFIDDMQFTISTVSFFLYFMIVYALWRYFFQHINLQEFIMLALLVTVWTCSGLFIGYILLREIFREINYKFGR